MKPTRSKKTPVLALVVAQSLMQGCAWLGGLLAQPAQPSTAEVPSGTPASRVVSSAEGSPDGSATASSPTASTPPIAATPTTPAVDPRPELTVEAALGFTEDDAARLDKVREAFERRRPELMARVAPSTKVSYAPTGYPHRVARFCRAFGKPFGGRSICAGGLALSGDYIPPTVEYFPYEAAQRVTARIPPDVAVLRWHDDGKSAVVVTPDGGRYRVDSSALEPLGSAPSTPPKELDRDELLVHDIFFLVEIGELPDQLRTRIETVDAKHRKCIDRIYDAAEKREDALLVADLRESTRENRIAAVYAQADDDAHDTCGKIAAQLRPIIEDAEKARNAQRRALHEAVAPLLATPAS